MASDVMSVRLWLPRIRVLEVVVDAPEQLVVRVCLDGVASADARTAGRPEWDAVMTAETARYGTWRCRGGR